MLEVLALGILLYAAWGVIWWKRRDRIKLARGRCCICDRVLRDDAQDPFCSDECAATHLNY